jgi:hypothetical protein
MAFAASLAYIYIYTYTPHKHTHKLHTHTHTHTHTHAHAHAQTQAVHINTVATPLAIVALTIEPPGTKPMAVVAVPPTTLAVTLAVCRTAPAASWAAGVKAAWPVAATIYRYIYTYYIYICMYTHTHTHTHTHKYLLYMRDLDKF